jgi:hypothetical protein
VSAGTPGADWVAWAPSSVASAAVVVSVAEGSGIGAQNIVVLTGTPRANNGTMTLFAFIFDLLSQLQGTRFSHKLPTLSPFAGNSHPFEEVAPTIAGLDGQGAPGTPWWSLHTTPLRRNIPQDDRAVPRP